MPTDYSAFRATKEQVGSFYKAPYDPAKGRAKLVSQIKRTIAQLNGDKVSPRGGKDFETLHANGIAYRPTLNGQPIELLDTGDEDGFHADRDKLIEMLPLLIKDVEAGEFDEQIEQLTNSVENPPVEKAKGKGSRNYSAAGLINISMNNRHNKTLSNEAVQDKLLKAGRDPELVKAAIATRKDPTKK